MIKKSIAAIALLLSSTSYAGDLEQLRDNLAQLTSFKAAFKQTVKDEQAQIVQQAQGELLLQQPNNIRWQQTSPDETLLVSNSDKIYYFDEFAEQVSIFDAKKLITSTPFILLTTSDDALWQQYTVTKLNKGYKVTPKNNQDSQVSALVIVLDQQQLGLAQLQIEDVSGQTSYL